MDATTEAGCRDPLIPVRGADRLIALYFDGTDPTDPRADVQQVVGPHLAPLLIQVGEREILRPAAELFGQAQQRAGGECELQNWPNQIHVFQMFYRLGGAASAALADVARFVAGLDARAISSAG